MTVVNDPPLVLELSLLQGLSELSPNLIKTFIEKNFPLKNE
jgi:hypothetical protein